MVFQNNKTADMLVYQTNSLGVKFLSNVNTFVCSYNFAFCAGRVSENALLKAHENYYILIQKLENFWVARSLMSSCVFPGNNWSVYTQFA